MNGPCPSSSRKGNRSGTVEYGCSDQGSIEGGNCVTSNKRVLMIGLDPKVVDYSHLPVKLDEPTLRAALIADEERLRDLGYDARWQLIDRGETAEAVVS